MKYVLGLIAVAGCLALGWFVYQESERAMATPTTEQVVEPLTVRVTRTRRQPMEDRIELVGSLEPVASVMLMARVSGYIESISAEIGDSVRQGELVVELDAGQHRERVTRAEAALKVAKAQLQAQRARENLARGDVKRQQELSNSGVSTRQEFDQFQAQLDIAIAEVELQQASVDQAESDLLQSKLALEETRIVSPLDGVVAERFADVGDLAGTSFSILRISDISTVRTVVNVVEKDYEKIQSGQSASISVDAFPEQTFEGKVVRKAPVLSLETRTAPVHIEIQNPQRLLKPGMHARVQIVFARHQDAEVVPVASLVHGEEHPTLFVVVGEPPQSQLRSVQTGISDGEDVEILSGLEPNDLVITLGSRLIQDGQPIVPIDVSPPQESSSDVPSSTASVIGE